MKPIEKLNLTFNEKNRAIETSTPYFDKINELIEAVNQLCKVTDYDEKTTRINEIWDQKLTKYEKFSQELDEFIDDLKKKIQNFNPDEYKEKEKTIQDLHNFEEENREPEKTPYVYVEECENWKEIFVIKGKNCCNCQSRNGYPFRGQPDKKCKNFKLINLAQSDFENQHRKGTDFIKASVNRIMITITGFHDKLSPKDYATVLDNILDGVKKEIVKL